MKTPLTPNAMIDYEITSFYLTNYFSPSVFSLSKSIIEKESLLEVTIP